MTSKANISPKEARRFHRAFSRQQQKYEKAAAKALYPVLKDQVNQFLNAAHDYPAGMERQAVNEITPNKLAKVYKRIAIRVGVGYARITEAEMTAEESGEKSFYGQPKRGLGHIMEVDWNANPYETKSGQPGDRDMIDAYLRLYGARYVTGITETTRKWIAEQIVKGQQAGLTFDQVAKGLITSDIPAMRALRIARTETVTMMNLGRFIAANKSNFQKEKIWISSHDNRVRPGINSENSPFDHHEVDIKKVDLEEPFEVSGEHLMFPGDSSMGASAGNRVNCRCSFALQTQRDKNGRMLVKPKPMTVYASDQIDNMPEGVSEVEPAITMQGVPQIGIVNLLQALIAGAQLGTLLGLTFESLFGLNQNQ